MVPIARAYSMISGAGAVTSAHMSRCASGSAISRRSHIASSSRQRGSAKRSQISSPTSAWVMVPSKSTMTLVSMLRLVRVAVLELVGGRGPDLGDGDVELERHARKRVVARQDDVVALERHDPEGVGLALLVGALELGARLELDVGGQLGARHADLLVVLVDAVALLGRNDRLHPVTDRVAHEGALQPRPHLALTMDVGHRGRAAAAVDDDAILVGHDVIEHDHAVWADLHRSILCHGNVRAS